MDLVFPLSRKEAESKGLPYSTTANRNALFPTRLKLQRSKKGLTQEKLAQKIGVTKSTISLYEVGDNVPDIKTLAALADFFGVSADYFLGKADCQAADNEEIHRVTGLSELAIERLKQFKDLGFHHALSALLAHDQFIASLSHMSNFLDSELAEGYHAIVPEADIQALKDDGKGKGMLVDRSEIVAIYSTRAKERMIEAINAVLNEKSE